MFLVPKGLNCAKKEVQGANSKFSLIQSIVKCEKVNKNLLNSEKTKGFSFILNISRLFINLNI